MRKAQVLGLLVIPALFTVGCSDEQDVTPTADLGASKTALVTGNGAPSGSHYNLNIIGTTEKSAPMDDNNGHRIFVDLGSKTGPASRTKIMLQPGNSFDVLDANGTDGTASFQLPADVATSYDVYARALGGPGGKARMTTCADGDLTEDGYLEVCSDISLEMTAGPKPKFENVSAELLYVTLYEDIVDVYGNVLVEADTYPLFDSRLEDYFWQYDNNGLKLLQLRFYPKN